MNLDALLILGTALAVLFFFVLGVLIRRDYTRVPGADYGLQVKRGLRFTPKVDGARAQVPFFWSKFTVQVWSNHHWKQEVRKLVDGH